MSLLTFNTVPHAAGFGSSGQPSRALNLVRTFAAEWRLRRAARRVESLSDEMLHDIGITRGEIDQAVRCGRSGR